jgi:hypothetical protein
MPLLKDQLLRPFKIKTAPTYCPRCDHRNIIRRGRERASYDAETGEWRSYGWTFEGFDESTGRRYSDVAASCAGR